MAKTLQEVEESIFYEVHCTNCGVLLGYFIELPEFTGQNLHECRATCWECRGREVLSEKK